MVGTTGGSSSSTAWGGSAVIINESTKHYELKNYSPNNVQTTSISVNDRNNDHLTVVAIYWPPQEGADEI